MCKINQKEIENHETISIKSRTVNEIHTSISVQTFYSLLKSLPHKPNQNQNE